MPTSITEQTVTTENDKPEIILMDSSDANMESFTTTLPLDFDSSLSSVDSVVESVTESEILETGTTVLTDIAEETIYDTSFYDEKSSDEKNNKIDLSSVKKFIEQNSDIHNIVVECDIKDENVPECNDDSDKNIIEEDINGEKNENDNDVHFNNLASSDFSNICNVIADGSNDTEMISENNSDGNCSIIDVAPVTLKNNTTYSNITNLIHVNSINNKKLSIKPVKFTSTAKFVPINIAPNLMKRPANISIGQPSSNVITKVVVSQGKVGQPIMITNSPQKQKPLCLLSNPCSTQSSVKCITFAEAKQMGLIPPGKLQPIQSSVVTKQVVVNNIPTTVTIPTAVGVPAVVQGLKKLQPLKPATPPKILPAPLVSNASSITNQPQKFFVRQDYVMQSAGTLIPKQQSGQVITISNLQSSSILSNNISPKKQVKYIKLVNNVGSTNMPTVTTAKGAKITAVTQAPSIATIDKDTPIIVASSNFLTQNLNLKNAKTLQTCKSTPRTVTVLPMSNLKTTPGQRLILPAVSKGKSDTVGSLSVTDSKSQKSKPAGNIVVLRDDILEKLRGDLIVTPGKLADDTRLEYLNKGAQDKDSVIELRARSPNKHVNSFPLETGPPGGGNGFKSRKPCNCTRSQCLKLYCECFANGEFCHNCNCVSCHNNITHEENRQHAIRSCLDRNPQAFRPKIGKCLVGLNDRRHTKGCHCKRSGCLKNYCECYEAQIPCSENCKCVGCKNVDDMLFNTSAFGGTLGKTDVPFEFQSFSKSKLTAEINDAVGQSNNSSNPRHAFSFIKDQVVEATCQCLLAQAEEIKRRSINSEDGQKYIIEEFGRCLIQIIECATNKCAPS